MRSKNIYDIIASNVTFCIANMVGFVVMSTYQLPLVIQASTYCIQLRTLMAEVDGGHLNIQWISVQTIVWLPSVVTTGGCTGFNVSATIVKLDKHWWAHQLPGGDSMQSTESHHCSAPPCIPVMEMMSISTGSCWTGNVRSCGELWSNTDKRRVPNIFNTVLASDFCYHLYLWAKISMMDPLDVEGLLMYQASLFEWIQYCTTTLKACHYLLGMAYVRRLNIDHVPVSLPD